MAYNIKILDPAQYSVQLAGQPYGSTLCLPLHSNNPKVDAWDKRIKAELYFNLGMFNMTGQYKNRGITYVHTPTGDLGYGGDSDTLQLPGGYACKGYSNGIKNGKLAINRQLGGSRTRNGIGITDRGHIIIAQCGHKVSEATFCNAVNSYVLARSQTVRLFVLEDGGGSTAEYSSVSKLGFYPETGRPVTTIVCVSRKNPITITRPIYNGCKGEDCGAIQIIVGGIPVDNDYGPTSARRVKAAQKALGFPAALQCGIVSAYTAKKLGYKSTI
jgi:hypothetical protein